MASVCSGVLIARLPTSMRLPVLAAILRALALQVKWGGPPDPAPACRASRFNAACGHHRAQLSLRSRSANVKLMRERSPCGGPSHFDLKYPMKDNSSLDTLVATGLGWIDRESAGEPAAKALAGRLELIRQAISFGSTEALIAHRAGMEGPDSPTPRDLLRLSVGIEDVEDLIADLRQALYATGSG
jgi:Cys/Met metabolism PLP-dependent enzyme